MGRALLIAVVAVFVLGVGALSAQPLIASHERSATARGVVTAHGAEGPSKRGGGYVCSYRFDVGGQPQSVSNEECPANVAVGTQVVVRFDPHKPSNAVVWDHKPVLKLVLALLALAVLVLVVAWPAVSRLVARVIPSGSGHAHAR